MNLGQLGGCNDLLRCGIHPAVPDIVKNCACEQENVLLDNADRGAQVLQMNLADILAVQKDATTVNFIEAWDQLTESRFSAAAGTYNGQHMTAGDIEVNVRENRGGIRFIGEGYVIKDDVAFHVFNMDCIRSIDDVRLDLHDLKIPKESGHALGKHFSEVGQLTDGRLDAGHIHVERDQGCKIHPLVHDERRTTGDDEQTHECQHEFRPAHKSGHHMVIGFLAFDVFLGACAELLNLIGFRAEGLGRPNAAQRGLNFGIDGGGFLLDCFGGAHHVLSPVDNKKQDDRN